MKNSELFNSAKQAHYAQGIGRIFGQKGSQTTQFLAAYDYKWKTRLEVFYTHGSPVINEETKNINHKATKAQSFLSKNFNHLVSWWLRGEISQ